jgi:hypothetical protein
MEVRIIGKQGYKQSMSYEEVVTETKYKQV